MGKFIIVLVIIFVMFYFGGAVLFDSGIADSKGISRVPAAVQVEKFYNESGKIARVLIKKVEVAIDPAKKLLIQQANGPEI